MPEITRIKVLDHGDLAEAVVPDVRPVRAVILAAVLSLFFVVVIFLLWELSRDSIWLPATADGMDYTVWVQWKVRDLRKM